MATINMHMKLKFQSKVDYAPETMSSTDKQMDGRMDGQGESSIPPSNFVGRGYDYNNGLWHHMALSRLNVVGSTQQIYHLI